MISSKKESAWSGWVSVCVCVPVCMRVYSYMNSCMRILRVFLTIYGVCACMCLDYLFENLPIYSSMEEMYGSYSSATSSQEGQFVKKKKHFSEYFSFFPHDCLCQSFTILAHFYSSEVLEGDVVLQTKKSPKQLK